MCGRPEVTPGELSARIPTTPTRWPESASPSPQPVTCFRPALIAEAAPQERASTRDIRAKARKRATQPGRRRRRGPREGEQRKWKVHRRRRGGRERRQQWKRREKERLSGRKREVLAARGELRHQRNFELCQNPLIVRKKRCEPRCRNALFGRMRRSNSEEEMGPDGRTVQEADLYEGLRGESGIAGPAAAGRALL